MNQQELRITTLRNRYHRRPNSIEEEIDLRRQTKKKIDNIEILKKDVKYEVKGAQNVTRLKL